VAGLRSATMEKIDEGGCLAAWIVAPKSQTLPSPVSFPFPTSFLSLQTMPKSSKKGRLTGEQRKDINKKAVHEALDEPEGVIFGRVIKHLGMGNIQVMLKDQKLCIAKIRTVLSRRGATPITADDVVILSPRDFETEADNRMKHDVLGVMTKGEASKLAKAGHIPAWFLQSGADTLGGAAKAEEDVFDYSDVKQSDPDATAEASEDEDVDVDDL
jgi:translation initiation factor IF-1